MDLPPMMRLILKMLKAFLKEKRQEAIQDLVELDKQGIDPEGFFYRAPLFARLERRRRLSGVSNRPYGEASIARRHSPTIAPSKPFEPIPHFANCWIMQTRSNEAPAAFIAAGGERLLGWPVDPEQL